MRHITTGNLATRIVRLARVWVLVGVSASIVVLADSQVAAAPAAAARGTALAVRLDLPQIVDTTDPQINGQPLVLLAQTYTMAELAAGGPVTIAFSTAIDGRWAMVPREADDYHECGDAPRCVLITRARWETPDLADPIDINRVVISHEWGHVLSAAYRAQLTYVELAQFNLLYAVAGEECLADAIAALALQRAGLPPNQTATYEVRYPCEQQTEDAAELAREVLDWADSSRQ